MHVGIFGLTAILVGGGWYLRALVHTGNPVYPFFRHVFGGAGLDEVLDPIKRPMAVTAWNLLTALGPMTLEPDRFDSFSHQFGPVFLLFLPALALERAPRRVLGIAGLGYAFLMLCLTQRQSMRFVLIGVGPLAVAVAWLASTWWERRSTPGRILVAVLVAGARVRGEPGPGPRAARARGRARPRDRIELPGPARADVRVGAMGRRPPAPRGPDRGPGPSRLLLPARLHDGAGAPAADRPGDAASRRRRSWPACARPASPTCCSAPPIPESAVEFDPTLGRLLAPWLAGRAPLYRDEIADPDGVVRRYAIHELSPRVATATRGGGAAMTDRPTLAELRGRVQKDRHREIGNWLARRVARPSAVYGTWLAVRLGASAHQVTLLALAGQRRRRRWRSATGTRRGFVAGVALAHLAFWLDHVDGQVARWRGTASLDGVYFDYLMHHAASLGLGFALGYGLAARTGDVRWAAAGFADRPGLGLPEPAQRLPVQGLLPAPEARDRLAPRRRRRRRPPEPSRPVAPARPGRPDLAPLQGVRAARRPDGPDPPRPPRRRRPLGLAERSGAAGSSGWPSSPRSWPRRGRRGRSGSCGGGRVRALVPARYAWRRSGPPGPFHWRGRIPSPALRAPSPGGRG